MNNISLSDRPRIEDFIHVALKIDAMYDAAFEAVSRRAGAISNTPTDDEFFIIDSGATTSVVTKLGLFKPDSLRLFGKTEHVSILGISGDAGLKTPGVGQLPTPFANSHALYVPDAISNILSWWDIRATHKIKLRRQDREDEHLELVHKVNRTISRCYIHPVIGMYVYRPDAPRATERIFSLSHISQLQKLGLNRKAAARAARCQDLHECLGFCHPEAMRSLINRRGNKEFTNADYEFWTKHYHPEYCRGCPARANAPPHHDRTNREMDSIGTLVHADLFQIVSKLPAGCFNAIAFVDDSSGHKDIRILDNKTKGSLMDAVYEVAMKYKRAGGTIKELRTDGEPAFACLTDPLERIHAIKHTMCEEYRHEASAERAIQTIEKKFLAFIHGADVPIPTFLYKDLLSHTCHMDNAVFNSKNSGLTPRELLTPPDARVTTQLEDFLENKFGSLRSYHDPRSSDGTANKASDESKSSFGIYIGADPSRPHCHILWDFLKKTRHSVAHSTKRMWDSVLEQKYLEACDGALTSQLPYFADGFAASTANDIVEESADSEEASEPDDAMDCSPAKPTATHQKAMAQEIRKMQSQLTPSSRPFTTSLPAQSPSPERLPGSGLAPTRHNVNPQAKRFNDDLNKAMADKDQADEDAAWTAAIKDCASAGSNLEDAVNTLVSSLSDNQAIDLATELRRSARIRGKAGAHEAVIMNMSIAMARRSHDHADVSNSVLKELRQMDASKMDVWDYMTPDELQADRDAGKVKNIIPSSLFLKTKADNSLKARLVVRGDRQILQDLFGSNSSPTININVLLTVLSLAAKENYDFESVDITGAYLNAVLPEPEYMQISADLAAILIEEDPSRIRYLDDKGRMVVKLKKALYGLKNSGKLWYDTMNEFMVSIGFTRSNIDKCMYTYKAGSTITHALVYVDDILLIGNDTSHRSNTRSLLRSKFNNITEQPINNITFLGMKIAKQSNGDISVDQATMISEILEEYNTIGNSSSPAAINITNSHSQASNAGPELSTNYRSLNMKLLYLATRTRPDILFATVVLATRSQNPSQIDSDRLHKILQYLNGTQSRCLTYKKRGPLKVNAHVDSSFNLHWDAKGHSGFAVFPDVDNSAATIVKSAKHQTTADSSTEAELIALHMAVKYICWIADIYTELGHDVKPVETYQDNKSSIALSSKEAINFRGNSKFINRKYFSVYEHIENGDIILTHIGTENMIADVLTKALCGEKFRRFSIALLGKQDV
jgi:hypothetical protein